MTGASAESHGGDVAVVGTDKPQQGMDAERAGAAYDAHSDLGAYADNNDVWRRRFAKHGVTRIKRYYRKFRSLLAALLVFLREFVNPKLSADEKRMMLFRMRRLKPEEVENHRQQKQRDALFQFHKQQAKLLQLRIIEVLTNLGFCYHITKNERKYIKKRISVAHVDISPYAYTYHLTRMPFGVKVTEIAQDWVSTELSASIGKKIRYDLDLEGLRITVEVGSTMSIPNFVGFGDLDDKTPMPKNLPPLAFWAGLSANGTPVYRNLAEAPHMIIAGSSGGGKSNMENCIACTLIRNNKPERLRVVFFDLKGGVEFDQYKDIPHLYPMKDGDWSTSGIVEFPSDVIPALKVLFNECMHRLDKLKKAGVKNIHEFNRKKRNHSMPYIVVFFDEWASTKKLVGSEAESLLSNIANLSRAAGIHFLLSTQYPKAEIINTTISVNFPWRLAFNMPSGASQSVLGDWGAVGLTPVGRAVLLTMDGQMQIQTPRITNQNVLDVVEEARTGIAMTRNMQNIDAADILEWSLNKAGMRLDQDSVFNQFKEKITQAALRELLRSMENKVYDVQGTLYKVMPSLPPNISRRMILAEEAGGEAENSTGNPLPATVSAKATENPPAPHICHSCGAQAFIDPCEYCGTHLEDTEVENAR
ncbi:MAG: DNA translocase FtsK [Chloroflexi bacterium]|nr:DNA translocase FtsK [Chloroflexota bacterium]